MSIDRIVCQETLQKNFNNSKLSGIKMLEMHRAGGGKRKGQVVVPIPSYQNCTPPISIPMMKLGKVSSS